MRCLYAGVGNRLTRSERLSGRGRNCFVTPCYAAVNMVQHALSFLVLKAESVLRFRLNSLKISLRSCRGLQFWVFEVGNFLPLTCWCGLLCLTYCLAWLASGWELPAQLISGPGLIWFGSAPDLCLKYPLFSWFSVQMQSETVGSHIEIVLFCTNVFGQGKTHGRTIEYPLDDVMFIDLLFSFEHIHCLFILIMFILRTAILQLWRIQLCSLFLRRINKRISFVFVRFLLMKPHFLKHKNLLPHIFYILYLHQWCTVTSCGCLFICLTDY